MPNVALKAIANKKYHRSVVFSKCKQIFIISLNGLKIIYKVILHVSSFFINFDLFVLKFG